MRLTFFVLMVLNLGHDLLAQTYRSTESEITFFSSAPMEDIKATNKKASSLFDASSGSIAIVVPISGFQFRKSLMQQHFNENYLESDKYPNATFEGLVKGFDPSRSGIQKAIAEGVMNIHGVSKPVKIEGQIQKTASSIKMETKFPIRVADYNIDIPKVVFYNIAEVVEVTAVFTFQEK